MRTALAFLAVVFPFAAQAGDLVSCETAVNGARHTLTYDPETLPEDAAAPGIAARLLGGKGGITCPGPVTLRALTPEMDDAARAAFCLRWDEGQASYTGYDLGPRDADLTCRQVQKAFCEKLALSKPAVAATRDWAVSAGSDAALNGAGVVSVKAPTTLVAEKLLTFGGQALQGATPLGMLATVVVVGGAVHVCSEAGAAGAALLAQPAWLKPGEVAPGALLPVQVEERPVPPPAPIAVAPLPAPPQPVTARPLPPMPDTPVQGR